MHSIKALRGGAIALAIAVSLAACKDFHLAASNLEIGPNPAVAGDQMVATVIVSLLPTQRNTIILTIDDQEHFRVSSNEAPAIPFIIELGDASGLIAKYGLGMHSARVEVRAEDDDESARTQSVSFELRDATP